MNRISIRSKTVPPSNGLDSIVVIWHTPGTNKVTYVRRYIRTAGVTTAAKVLFTLTNTLTIQ